MSVPKLWRLGGWYTRRLIVYQQRYQHSDSNIIFFVYVWRKNIFDIYITEYGTALTTILPILFLYLNTVKWQPEPLNRNESGRFGTLKSDSTHHFFRNACTKSGSLRFSQFSGCWLILSVYIIMSFDFPFVGLFGVR